MEKMKIKNAIKPVYLVELYKCSLIFCLIFETDVRLRYVIQASRDDKKGGINSWV
mgnify:CR=1 FL=1